MVLALLDIRRARAPYRLGPATGGEQQDAIPAPQRASSECRDRSTLFQAATGAQPATNSVPRRSARLQVWCASNRVELEPGRQRASSLAPLLPVRKAVSTVEACSTVHVSAHGRETRSQQKSIVAAIAPDAL